MLLPKNMELKAVIDWMHGITKKPILLLVDEIMKLGRELATKTLHRIAECLKYPKKFETVISTLNSDPILNEKLYSRRQITWLPLSPLSYNNSLKLFKAFPLNNDAKLAISDCKGHPRSLECMFHAFRKAPKDTNYKLIIEAALKEWEDRYTHIHLQHIKIALEGKRMLTADSVQGLCLSTEIESGSFLNVNTTFHVIPAISPFVLRVFVRNSDSTDPLIFLFKKLLETEARFGWKGLGFKEYENFHSVWECIKRHLYQGRTVSLSAFYVLMKSMKTLYHILC
jgi:hypothetical protein